MGTPNSQDPGSSSFTKSSSLGSRIIRLAHNHPEFRDALQPLLYVIAAKKEKTGPATHSEADRAEDQKEFKELLAFGPRFGIVSAFKGGNQTENKIRRSSLVADLQHLGYRKVSPMKGKWNLLPEQSYLIQNIRPEDLFELGRKYNQEYVVFSNETGLVGFYYLKGDPRARIIVDPAGDTTFRSLTDVTPYSKARGLDVDFGLLWSEEFPWDGRSALNRKRVRQELKHRGLQNVTP